MTVHTRPGLFPTDGLSVEATYNAAAEDFEAPPLRFWSRHGTATVDRLDPRSGMTVLDLGCGTGCSAIPAAIMIGPFGNLLGIDIADNMLARARGKAEHLGIAHADFKRGDLNTLALDPESYDAVISVFSLFFADDMVSLATQVWSALKPGGKFAVTVWCDGAFDPLGFLVLEELTLIKRDYRPTAKPWRRLTHPVALRALMAGVGFDKVEIQLAGDRQPLRSPDDAWTLAMGTGMRGEIEALGPAEREVLRSRVLTRVIEEEVTSINTNALIAVARKPKP